MHEFPTKVTISIPTRVDTLHGSASTCSPHGYVSSIRLPKDEVATIDRARKIIDLDISRSGFIRLAAYRTAIEICKHYDGRYNRIREEDDDDANTTGNVQPTSRS